MDKRQNGGPGRDKENRLEFGGDSDDTDEESRFFTVSLRDACPDYIFQDTAYEEQVKQAAELLKNVDAVLIGAGAGTFRSGGAELRRQPLQRKFRGFY